MLTRQEGQERLALINIQSIVAPTSGALTLRSEERHGETISWRVGAQPPLGVTRYASNTESIERRRLIAILSAWVSPTSMTKRFLTIGCWTLQYASTMLIPPSANVRERSSRRRWRSHASTWISTLKEVSLSPSQDTGTKRSGSLRRATAFGQSSRWIVMPRPSET